MLFSSLPISQKLEGAILAHSIKAGAKSYKKGRKLSKEDLQILEKSDIHEVMVAILEDGDIHEDEAAETIAELIKGQQIDSSAAFTGRVNLFAKTTGLCFLDVEQLQKLNRLHESITVATIDNFSITQPKQMIATIKIIPFSVPMDAMNELTKLIDKPLVEVHSFNKKNIILIQTQHDGTKATILDKTGDVLNSRLALFGMKLNHDYRCLHDITHLTQEIQRAITSFNPDILIIAGASAITDRSDVIPSALVHAGGIVQRFGMPVDPGNLLMLGDIGSTKVVGMPGCARSPKLNGFDWILQRLLANIKISNDDISDMAIGGLLKEISSRPLPRTSTGTSETVETPAKQPNICAVILAAGQSRRMGKNNKLLLKIDGVAMVRRSADIVIQSSVAEIFVVTGHEREQVESTLSDLDLRFINNPLYEDGISSSLKAGIANIPHDVDGVLICLGDMPLIVAKDIEQLIASFAPHEGRSICVPTFKGKWGNPVLIGKQFFSEIQELTGDIGARHLISEYPDLVCEVEVKNDGVLHDFDNPESFKRFD